MTLSAIDKRIKNCRLTVERARDPEYRARAEKELGKALAAKEAARITRR